MNLDISHWMRPGILQLPELPPLSLYVHLPWCLKKCPYCDFNSHEWRTDATAGKKADSELSSELQWAYLDALLADLDTSLPLVWGRPIQSVFIGGGTPSLFSAASMARLISDLRARLPLLPGAEISLEANPGTFEKNRFRAFREAGVTRLSVGVQSFDDAHLQALGRVHDAQQAWDAVQEASKAFDTYNLDLMYALPGQNLDRFASDLDTVLRLSPPHVSIYHLTIEPNTLFHKHTPRDLPSDDEAYAMLDLIVEKTQAQSLNRYEVSAFAKKGHRCAHNLNYWQFGDYLGLGAGAHSKISFPHRVTRWVKHREPQRYIRQAMAGAATAQTHEINRKDLPFEFMLNALRLKDGVSLQVFLDRTGLPLSSIEPSMQTAQAKGWLKLEAGLIQPTPLGFDFLSDLQALFLPDADDGHAG